MLLLKSKRFYFATKLKLATDGCDNNSAIHLLLCFALAYIRDENLTLDTNFPPQNTTKKFP